MITVAEADAILRAHLRPFPTVKVPLAEAVGRVLAEPLIADRDFPPFHRVAMDGFALDWSAVQAGQQRFEVVQTQRAGMPETVLPKPEVAVEVMTGAVVPKGATVVVRLEDVAIETQGEQRYIVLKNPPEKIWQNIHQQGIDRRQGETIVPEGRLLTPAEIAVAATVGKATLAVRAVPRIAVVSTGDELVEITATPAPHQIRRSNAAVLQAFLRTHQFACELFHTGDAWEQVEMCVAPLLQHYDVVISTGSVSAGEVDILPSVLRKLGVQIHFHKVAQRPGKPLLFGQRDQCTVFALPGNPVSTVVCFLRYVLPWLRASQGLVAAPATSAQLSEPFTFKPSLTYFLPVRLLQSPSATWLASPLVGHGSGDFANLVDCDGFLELPAEKSEFAKGEVYPLWRYRPER